MSSIDQRINLENFLDRIVQALPFGTAMTPATWDDETARLCETAWSMPIVRTFIVEQVHRVIFGGEVLALSVPPAEAITAGIDAGKVFAWADWLIEVYQTFRKFFGQ